MFKPKLLNVDVIGHAVFYHQPHWIVISWRPTMRVTSTGQ